MNQPVDLPVADMVVGDSFFVPCIDPEALKLVCARLARDYGYDLRIEKVVHNGLLSKTSIFIFMFL